MACGDYADFLDYWLHGQFFDGVLCPYQTQLGGVEFGMFVYAGIGIGLYIYSGSVVLPLAVTIVLGAIIAAAVPAIALQVGVVALVLTIAVSGMAFIKNRMEVR